MHWQTSRALALGLLSASLLYGADWPRFRGPNGSGTAESANLPVEFGPAKNVVWKTALPPGHSSPVIAGDRIFLTAGEGGQRADAGREKVVDEGGKLLTIALDGNSGKILWRREAPRPRLERYQPTNSPASPSPVTDGENVYVFFGDYGLISYTKDGDERWRYPLGPFNNVNGHGSSPILAGNRVVMLCDQDTGSYMIALDKESGEVGWRVERPEYTRSYTTPAVFEPGSGPPELIIPGAYYLASYSAETGEKLWWVRGMSWQPKSTPVVHGNMIYAHAWEGGGDATTPTETPAFETVLAKADKDGDKLISETELAEAEPKTRFYTTDLDSDGLLDERDWEFYRARRAARNTLVAVRHGGRGDLTGTEYVRWRMQKFLPNVPSPLLFQGVLYIVKDGGILTAINPETGEIFKQGRLDGAIDTYYSSPVGAAGKVYTISQGGKATVLKAGVDWEVLAANDLGDEVYATPAIIGDRIYIRTNSALYCFAEKTKQ